MKLDPKVSVKTRTYKYLYPTINAYKDNYLNSLLNSVLKVLITVEDKDKKIEGENIFIAINKNLSSRFLELLNYVRKQNYFVTDYPYSEDIHVIVLKVPEEYYDAYYNFLSGRYSEMYTEEQIKELFNTRIKKGNLNDVKVLRKDKSLNKKIKKLIQDRYDVLVEDEELDKFEKDLPPYVFKEEFL